MGKGLLFGVLRKYIGLKITGTQMGTATQACPRMDYICPSKSLRQMLTGFAWLMRVSVIYWGLATPKVP